MEIFEALAKEFNIREEYSKNLIGLLDEGGTIPFIARYRKEMHGSCDDQVLRNFADRLKYLRNLDEEKAKVEKVITEQGKWTDELATALAEAMTLTEVEDIYRPYKPKRKTRASVAIAKGLEPLADILQAQSKNYVVAVEAEKFITEEVATVEDVYEPYLIRLGFIARTHRGRVALPKAYEHLGIELEEKKLKELKKLDESENGTNWFY